MMRCLSFGSLGATFLGIGLTACGARSAIDDATSEGGAGGTSSTTSRTASTGASTTSASSGSTSGGMCPTLDPSDVTLRIFGEPGVVDPELALMSEGTLGIGTLFLSGMNPGGAFLSIKDWQLEGTTTLRLGDEDVDEIAMGPGPDGPIVVTHDAFLQTRIGTPELLSAPLLFGNAPHLFVAGAGRRVLLATGGGQTLQVGSYVPESGVIETEIPLACVAFPLARAVPSGNGFLAVVGRANPPGDDCFAQPPLPATLLSVLRYDEAAEPGTHLSVSFGHQIVSPEPFIHGLITATSFGGWVVYQTDGSTSFAMPSIMAMRIRADGQVDDPANPMAPVAVSREGLPPSGVAVASMGDALVVAYADRSGERAQIIVQRIEPDGTRSATVTVPTGHVPYRGLGQIRLLTAPNQTDLAVAWEGGLEAPEVGVAILRCASAL